MTNEALQAALVFGVIFCGMMCFYLIWLCLQAAKKIAAMEPPIIPPVAASSFLQAPQVQIPKMPPRFLPTIQAFYADTEYNYVAIAAAPGHLVLAWREWAGDGYKDRALDVLLVRADGTVDTLGTCVDYEVYGPPPEKRLQRSET